MALTEEEKAKRRMRYQERREEIIAYQKQWQKNNPAKIAQYQYKSWMKKAESQQEVLNENNHIQNN